MNEWLAWEKKKKLNDHNKQFIYSTVAVITDYLLRLSPFEVFFTKKKNYPKLLGNLAY